MSGTDYSKAPITLVDLTLDLCSLVYGTAPCTAVVGTTGADRCYNTFATCQDPANYALSSRDYRFSNADGPILPGVNSYPCITGIQTLPTNIDQRRGLGVREVLRVELVDFIDEDIGVDNYVTQRQDRTPRRFFARLVRRNRNALKGRTLTLREGYLEADGTLIVSDMTAKVYAIETIELGAKGRVTLTAKDPIYKLDGVNIPAVSDGKLAAAINSGALTCAVGSGEGAQYGSAPFYFRVNDEIMKCTAISGDTFTTIARAQFGTTAAAHSANDKVQKAQAWEGSDAVDDIWEDILTLGGLIAGQLNKADFTTDVDKYLAPVLPSVCLTEPTPALQLLSDLMIQTNCITWYDSEEQKVQAAHIKPRQPGETLATITDDEEIIGDSAQVQAQEDLRATRAYVAHGIKDWSQSLDELANYSGHVKYIDSDAESANEGNSVKERTLYCYWLPASINTTAQSLCYRIVSKFRNPPRRIPCDIEAKDADSLQVGDLVELTTYLLVDDSGAPVATECFIVSKRRRQGRLGEWSIVLEESGTAGQWMFWAPDTALAYPSDPDYGHWAGADEKMPNGDAPYLWG